MPIGVIGLGNVGSSMGKHLSEQGYDVVGYDLDEEARARAADQGVDVAPDTAEVAQRASVVVLCLPHPDASRAAVDIVAKHGGPGTDIFDTSTISPLTARKLAETAQEADLHYFDSPITGGAVGAARGDLTILVGGDPDRIESHDSLLTTIASDVYHIGEVGDAQFVKLVHNHVGQTVLALIIESLFLSEAYGVDPATLYRVLRHWTGIYDDKLDAFFSNEFAETFEEHFSVEEADDGVAGNRFELDVAHKDLLELTSMAEEYGVHFPLGNAVEQYHRQGVNAGYGDRPHPDLLQFYESMFDVHVETTEAGREKRRGKLI